LNDLYVGEKMQDYVELPLRDFEAKWSNGTPTPLPQERVVSILFRFSGVKRVILDARKTDACIRRSEHLNSDPNPAEEAREILSQFYKKHKDNFVGEKVPEVELIFAEWRLLPWHPSSTS